MKTLCIYHMVDFDGMCSAAIVRKKYPEAELFGANYGEEIPWDKIDQDTQVFICDFSYPMDDMLWIKTKCNELIWCDHHATALDEYVRCGGNFKGLRPRKLDDGSWEKVAGCELTWIEVFPKLPMPIAVQMLGRYDVWDHKDPDVLPFQYGLRLENPQMHDLQLWDAVLTVGYNPFIGNVINQGRSIIKYQEQQDKIAASAAFEQEIMGMKMLCLNSGHRGSKQFDSAFDREYHDGMLWFKYNGKKHEWWCSVYTDKPEIDVSIIAVHYGGGGHKGAAGFSLDPGCINPWELSKDV